MSKKTRRNRRRSYKTTRGKFTCAMCKAVIKNFVCTKPYDSNKDFTVVCNRRCIESSGAKTVSIQYVTRRLFIFYFIDICPFCCKLKAFLDWKRIPYSAVDVNPISKQEIAFSENYRKVPIGMSSVTPFADTW